MKISDNNPIRTIGRMTRQEQSNGVVVRALTSEDEENVFKMLRKSFFETEPMNVSLGLANDQQSCQLLQQYCRKFMTMGLSLVAVTKLGSIVGVSLNAFIENNKKPEESNTVEEIINQASIPFTKIINLLGRAERECATFQKYPHANKLLDIGILSVDESYRGKGIAKELLNESRAMAEKLNCPLIQIICSSNFSAKAAERLGFRYIYRLPYTEYVDDNGKQLISPAYPHTEIAVLVLDLSERP